MATEHVENCDGSNILASVHTMLRRFETGRKFDGSEFAKSLMAKRCTYTLKIDNSHSKSVKHIPFSSFSGIHAIPFSRCAC